jgi:hypothetical protein
VAGELNDALVAIDADLDPVYHDPARRVLDDRARDHPPAERSGTADRRFKPSSAPASANIRHTQKSPDGAGLFCLETRSRQ